MRPKKILAAFLAIVMMVSTFVFSSNSASGTIVFSDAFDLGFKSANWIQDPSCAFRWDEDCACVHGNRDATSLQSNYAIGNPKIWDQYYASFDFQIRAYDNPEDDDTNAVALWYRDLWENDEGAKGAVYQFKIDINTMIATLEKEHDFKYRDGNAIVQSASIKSVIAEAQISSDIEVGTYAPWYDIGMKITEGKILCVFDEEVVIVAEVNDNDEKLGDYAINSVDPTVGSQKSPVVFLNYNNYVAIDNFEVWTSDIGLGFVVDENNTLVSYRGGEKNIIIPDNITSIGDYAFESCTNLTSITIPNSVTSISDRAFHNCSDFTILCYENSYARTYAIDNNIPYVNNCKHSDTTIVDATDFTCTSDGYTGDIVCNGCGITVAVGEVVPKKHSFDKLSEYIEPTYNTPGSKTGICTVCGENVTEEIPATGSSGFIINESGVLVFCHPFDDYVVIPNGVTSIGDYAFSLHDSLKSVTIPDSVTSIGDYAFECCTSLTSVTIPDSVTSIGSYAFQDCTSLKSVTIPNTVKSVGDYAFADCENLTGVIVGNKVTGIANGAFSGCSKLKFYCDPSSPAATYAIHNGIEYVPYYVYEEFVIENGVLTEYNGNGGDVCIPVGVTSIGASAFSFCSGVKTVTIPEGVTYIGTGAFSFCPGLTNVEFPSTLETIDTGAFAFCPALSEIDFPDGLDYIGDGAFSFCKMLSTLTTPKTMSYLGEGAFEDCTNLETVVISDDSTEIGDGAFDGCTSLTLRCYDSSVATSYAEANGVNYRLILCGDVDDNGTVSASDVTILGRNLAGADVSTAYGADYNRDGKINASDLTILRRKVAGANV